MAPVSEPSGPTRPRQVTMLAGLIMGGSAIVVALAFERMAGVHSLETQESVQKFLNGLRGPTSASSVQSMLTDAPHPDDGGGRVRDRGRDPGLPGAATQSQRPARADRCSRSRSSSPA